MKFCIEAACDCDKGKIRQNNEDNLWFDGTCLERENDGLEQPLTMEGTLKNGWICAVFDGMGGENFGEYASFAAAQQMEKKTGTIADAFASPQKRLGRLSERLNDAVRAEQRKLCTERMGSTMVMLHFSGRYAYVCNLGDSRAYHFRDGVLKQLSEDHVERMPGRSVRKAPLTQYLGMDTDELILEPHIAREELKPGDRYLLCSDGLTDMLTDAEIGAVMKEHECAKEAAEALVGQALAHGGKDNITVIVLRLI